MSILVGVSSCLLGEKVRWDAGHKNDVYVRQVLGEHFQFVPVCPELEVGMGVPREPVHLEGDPSSPRMVGNKTGDDWTARMQAWSGARLDQLAAMGLAGYILKRSSPSCGLERVAVKDAKGMPHKVGRGLFAAALRQRLPRLPLEEEGRLGDAGLRENFIVRVFAYHRAQQAFAGRYRRGDVVAFHTREKFLLMAHSPQRYRELGKLVAAIKDQPPAAFREAYLELFMAALEQRATPRKNVDVMLHILGFMKRELSAAQKAGIITEIETYRRGLVPLIVPLTLLAHYLRLLGVAYLVEQTYLQPAPAELALRNHV